MAKVTSKLQITLPKHIATQHGIAPGDEIEFESAGDVIRIVPARRKPRSRLSVEERLRLFDEATVRQGHRAEKLRLPAEPPKQRDWRREDLYDRDEPD